MFWMYIKSWLKKHLTWKHKVLTRKLLTFRLNLAKFELNYMKFGILSPSCNYSTPNGQLLSKFRRNVVTFLPRWRKFMTSCRLWLHAWVAVKSLLSQIRTWRVAQGERGRQIGTGRLGKSVRSVLRKSEKGSNVSCRGCNGLSPDGLRGPSKVEWRLRKRRVCSTRRNTLNKTYRRSGHAPKKSWRKVELGLL